MLAPTLSKDSTKLLFNDLDFQKFQVLQTTDDEPVVYLFNEESNVLIDEKNTLLSLLILDLCSIFIQK